MRVLTKDEFLLEKGRFVSDIKQGAIFLHPTDTIYGIGCSALDSEAVAKVRHAKLRTSMPFSILVPSKQWLYDNCKVDDRVESWVKKLPGAYTFILHLKNKKAVVQEVNNNLSTIGVRIPDHWFSSLVTELAIPIITTSANISGENFMTNLDNLDPRLKSKLNFLVYEGPKECRPSTLVDFTKGEPKLVKR
ncbi:MAG: L-threonylcarbamoyladenylate synthase [Candidatus Woesearchaeota archaeon]